MILVTYYNAPEALRAHDDDLLKKLAAENVEHPICFVVWRCNKEWLCGRDCWEMKWTFVTFDEKRKSVNLRRGLP